MTLCYLVEGNVFTVISAFLFQIGSFADKNGESHWLGYGYLTAKNIYPTNLLIHWQFGGQEAWCLATNLPDREMTLRYCRRMWIEEMFGGLKKHAFDLESTSLHNFLRLSRLTRAVAYRYVWLVSSGGRTIHSGLRHLVDRNDRRDLSIFQIGLRFVQRRLTNTFLSPFHFAPTYDIKLSGG